MLDTALRDGRLVDDERPGSQTVIVASVALRCCGRVRESCELIERALERAMGSGARGAYAILVAMLTLNRWRAGELASAAGEVAARPRRARRRRTPRRSRGRWSPAR